MTQPRHDRLPRNLTLHVGDDEALLDRLGGAGSHAGRRELVLAPTELHRRNLQRRLRESQTPKDGVDFAAPSAVGRRLLAASGRTPSALDRIDRLAAIRAALEAGEVASSPAVPAEPQGIEQVRTEIETVTGFHPDRLGALRGVADGLTAPVDADATETVEAAVDVQRALRRRASAAVSEVALLRRATRRLLATDGEDWTAAFPDAARVSLVGVSGLSTAHVDFLHAVLASTAVHVHLHLRPATGPSLARRLPRLFDLDDPGAVVFES